MGVDPACECQSRTAHCRGGRGDGGLPGAIKRGARRELRRRSRRGGAETSGIVTGAIACYPARAAAPEQTRAAPERNGGIAVGAIG